MSRLKGLIEIIWAAAIVDVNISFIAKPKVKPDIAMREMNGFVSNPNEAINDKIMIVHTEPANTVDTKFRTSRSEMNKPIVFLIKGRNERILRFDNFVWAESFSSSRRFSTETNLTGLFRSDLTPKLLKPLDLVEGFNKEWAASIAKMANKKRSNFMPINVVQNLSNLSVVGCFHGFSLVSATIFVINVCFYRTYSV